MILKLVKKISDKDDTNSKTDIIMLDNVKRYNLEQTIETGTVNTNLYINYMDESNDNLILVDCNKDLYSSVYVMNNNGQTIEKII